jgi:hypothetical protein
MRPCRRNRSRRRHGLSLEQTPHQGNTSTPLRVITISRVDSLRKSAYRTHCARRLVMIALSLEQYRGAGRLFIP